MRTLNNIKKQIIYRVKATNENPVKAGPKILLLEETAKFLSFPCIWDGLWSVGVAIY